MHHQQLSPRLIPGPTDGIIMVELHGLLSSASSSTVRAVLHTALADAAHAAIVDLSDLRVECRARLDVFPAAVRDHGSPAAALVLCGATPEMTRLMQDGVLGGIPLYGDSRTALEAVMAAQARDPDRWSLRLKSTPDAPARARDLVAAACRGWGTPDLRGPAALVVSELVTNAVQHARTDMLVRLVREGEHVYISVRDHSPVPSRSDGTGRSTFPYIAGPVAERGRGLHLVSTYTTAWGCTVAGDGKTVWAMLPTSGSD